jgi:hypothetical protein
MTAPGCLQVFVVTSPAMYGGSCPDTNGTTRLNRPCNNTVPCPPRHCVGSWEARNCSGDCGGGEGLLLEEFVITVTGAYNGEFKLLHQLLRAGCKCSRYRQVGCLLMTVPGQCISSSCNAMKAEPAV